MKKTILFSTIALAVSYSTTAFAQLDNLHITAPAHSAQSVLKTQWDAEREALSFIAHFQSREPKWQRAQVGTITPLYRDETSLQAYEVEILSIQGEAQGYLIIEANPLREQVAEFAFEGTSPTKILKSNLQDNRQYRWLWNGPGTSAVILAPKHEAILFTINPSVTQADFSVSRKIEQSDMQPLSRMRRDTPDSEEIVIDWRFSPFYQEYRYWPTSSNDRNECYAGCTPVAAAMLVDFYDRNGYPNMIGDETQQNHQANSPLMRETINQLRGVLKTYCREDGQGGTSQSNSINIVDYMNQRGDAQWKARRISYAAMTTFSYLIQEMKAQRPAMVHYHTQGQIGTNHSAIAFGYIYGGYWGDNFLTVRTGWSRQEQIQYNIKSMGTVEATIVTRKD
ncbi:hypothetical protein [Algicola sagamiensis]|uniref:hypothetical protein n=1 Tax=Algicola sagamiensis TaxID=163869 RepID=UPI00035D16F1|nr:hypothetical protein [Algicola sagamiensis]